MWTLINTSGTTCAGIFPSKASAEAFSKRFHSSGVVMTPIELLMAPSALEELHYLELWTWTEEQEAVQMDHTLYPKPDRVM